MTAWKVWGLGLASGLTLAGLVRLRQRGGFAGRVSPARADPELARFVRQKTILLTSFRRDGTPVSAPVSIAVDGDHAYVRSPGSGGKVKRIRRDPAVRIAPSTARGRATGAALPVRAELVREDEDRRAGWLLARKYPMLHGVFVPLIHRVRRAKYGPTVHMRLTPVLVRAADELLERGASA